MVSRQKKRAVAPANTSSPEHDPHHLAKEPRARTILGLFLVAALLLGATAKTYLDYRATWLRDTPRLSSCVRQAGRLLKKPKLASGVEPAVNAAGETVYLTAMEDRVVRCARTFDRELARQLATAFAEDLPEKRAAELAKAARMQFSDSDGGLRAEAAMYQLVLAALDPLPDEPAVRAAREEVVNREACRFDTPNPCPARPSPPALTFAAGIPGGLALIGALSLAMVRLARSVSGALARRRARRQTAAQELGTAAPRKADKPKRKRRAQPPARVDGLA